MITISLCMIVKNEEKLLGRCLDTVKHIVDEINILDTGSTDGTEELARTYTDRVFFYKWTDSYAAARNEAFKHATKEYILYLDADDVLLEEDQEKLLKLKETLDPSVDSVSMYYDNGVDDEGNVALRYRRNRLVKRSKNFLWGGDAHEYLNVFGNIINSDISITHKKEFTPEKASSNVGVIYSIFQQKEENGEEFSARDYFYYGNELREKGKFEKAIEQYNLHIKKGDGWIEDTFHACIGKADCYRALNQAEEELKALFDSFLYTRTPRPEACSRIGYNYQTRAFYLDAIYWYEVSANLKPDPDQWSFSYPAYSTWYPNLQLCVCYYRTGDKQKSYEKNEVARGYRPKDATILANKKLLENELGLTKEGSKE
ncbi:glycosyltransferase [Alkalicoccobacillus gibsonii]|uniref:glycosyltransferase n=1 Tax=Alkalicoccobacillus gibsonii TaxID=79881 RepID=UPI0035158335